MTKMYCDGCGAFLGGTPSSFDAFMKLQPFASTIVEVQTLGPSCGSGYKFRLCNECGTKVLKICNGLVGPHGEQL